MNALCRADVQSARLVLNEERRIADLQGYDPLHANAMPLAAGGVELQQRADTSNRDSEGIHWSRPLHNHVATIRHQQLDPDKLSVLVEDGPAHTAQANARVD